MDPKSVGVPVEARLGKHSGVSAEQRCQDLGFTLSKAELDGVYKAFHHRADEKRAA